VGVNRSRDATPSPTLPLSGGGSAPSPRRRRAYAALPLVLAVLAFIAPTWAQAGDAAAGRRKATQCQACHGLDGLSKLPEAPHLAGQPERYLVKSLDEYRSGARSNEMMSIVAKMLSDQDVADLAAYYAAIEISVTPPK
jgi:cytochrome c553